ncbi:MAG: S9 family peptidase [Gammaproteobacteria bacterium]|nr:S9 family peptidase [Gammaproteobacteria bacterium]
MLPKNLTTIGAAFCLIAACSEHQPPADEPPAPHVTYSAQQFFETTSYQMVPYAGHAFSPDSESLLISSDETGVRNVYRLPVAGGESEQLTFSEDQTISAVSWFPNDERFLYTFDAHGDEKNHVLVQEEDGTTADLTPGEDLKADFIGWNDDDVHFYLSSNERDSSFFDVYRYSASDYSRELVFENSGFAVVAVSRDGRWIALDKDPQSANSNVYLVDLESDEKTPVLITAHEGTVNHNATSFSTDHAYLVYTTDEFGEFRQAWRYDLESREKSALVKADWDVSYVSFSNTARYRAYGINADARTEVSLIDRSSGESVSLPELPPGDLANLRFSADDSKLALIVNSDVSPSDIFVVDLSDGVSHQLTSALNPAIDAAHLVPSSVIRYESFDRLQIPGILYRPQQASAENPAPAVVLVHGGPGGQSRIRYSPTIQHLVNHGYAVLAANNRGSSGYGKTFFHMDDRRHGEEDLQDIVYARKYLETLGWIDGDSIGIMGGSYGGYMVVAALAFEPDTFDVGIDIFGVTNWLRTLESVPPWWGAIRDWLYTELGDPVEDAERLRRISPLFHADNIKKPLLVVQGANDPRVLKVESDEIVATVQANEMPVEYLVFPDEGHGFTKRNNRIAASEAYLTFLDKYLRD